METTNPPPPVQPIAPVQPTPVVVTPKQNPVPNFFTTLNPQTKIIIGVAGFFILLVVGLFIFLPKRPTQVVDISQPIPSSTASASLVPRETSAFAKTDSFKQFDTDVSSFQNDNNTVDLSENLLSFPLLDMQVNFDK